MAATITVQRSVIQALIDLHCDDPRCVGECAECGWGYPCETRRALVAVLAERDASADTPPDPTPNFTALPDASTPDGLGTYWPESTD